ncbi:MAG TPA: response regulator [Elusimicrobiales bacterium]|nr:response regulator [Elusimicrobiales bacterium]
MTTDQLKILCIDDNRDIVQNVIALLTKEGFVVFSASDPKIGIAIAKKMDPDLILLDIMMPGMSGYEVCKALQQDEQTARIPVVFMSALTQPQNKVSALAAGGVDYLTKPFEKKALLEITRRYAVKKAAWNTGLQAPASRGAAAPAGGSFKFSDFKVKVMDAFKPDSAASKAITALPPGEVYKLAGILKITPARLARFLAGFAQRPYFPFINPNDIKLGVLPLKFALQNNIAAVNAPGETTLLAISHPFNFELHELIRNLLGAEFEFGITEPANISVLYKLAEEYALDLQKIPGGEGLALEEAALNRLRSAAKSVKNEINEPHVKYLTGKLLQFLGEEKPAEMRIEAKGACYLVRAGAPGALDEIARLNRMEGNMASARLKALGGMDIVERNKPQTGTFGLVCRSEIYRLTLATEVTDCGENLSLKPAA